MLRNNLFLLPVETGGRDEWLKVEKGRIVGEADEGEGYERYGHLPIRLYCCVDSNGFAKERYQLALPTQRTACLLAIARVFAYGWCTTYLHQLPWSLKGRTSLGISRHGGEGYASRHQTRDKDEWVTVWLTAYDRGRTRARYLTAFYSSAAFHLSNQKDHYPARFSAFLDGKETYKNEQKRIIKETIRRAFYSPIVSQTWLYRSTLFSTTFQ